MAVNCGVSYLAAHGSHRSPAAPALLRAVHRGGSAAIEDARRVLRNLHLIHLDDALLDAAGMLDPVKTRSLDAIHLAAAVIAPELTALVTYDKRMAEGVRRAAVERYRINSLW